MVWTTHYVAPKKDSWQGRADAPANSSFFQIIQLLNVPEKIPDTVKNSFALIGFCCDEGIRRNAGRVGAAAGPKAIREVLAKLPIQQSDIVCYDAGDITCTDGDLESAQQALAEIVAILLKQDMIPIVLGGGHELAWGHYQGIAKVLRNEPLGIVNFDAHYDMRPLLPDNKATSGTPFLQIAEARTAANSRVDYNCIGIQTTGNSHQLIETAKKYNTQTVFASDVENNQSTLSAFIQRIINDNHYIYVSLCLDVFAAAYAPGVSAPQPMGISPWNMMSSLRELAQSGKVIAYDIAELSPKYDIDNRTAKLAAQFIFEIIHSHKI